MAITKQIAKMILSEHARRPITGNLVMGGRQTVVPSIEEIREYMAEFGIPERETEFEIDQDTLAATGEGILDRNFFSMFTDAKFHSIDVTDYENAEIIHDMNYPLPDKFKGNFDFIFDGGVMDNIFNPAQFLMNCSELLRPGGRIIHSEVGSLWRGAYSIFSADYFLDYYALNNYEDCAVYYAQVRGNMLKTRWQLSQIQPFKDGEQDKVQKAYVSSKWPHLILAVAEKGEQSTSQKMPIQLVYRPKDDDWDTYLESCRRFARKKREPNIFGRPTRHKFDLESRLRFFFKNPVLYNRTNAKFVQNL